MDFILSGGEDPTDTIHADDIINVYVNGAAQFLDPDPSANPVPPIPIEADDGDAIRIEAIDYFGACRGIGPIYLHRTDCKAWTKLTNGRDDGCQGWPPGVVFFDKWFVIDLGEMPCPALYGYVTDAGSGLAIAGAKVKCGCRVLDQVKKRKTDGDGYYQFKKLDECQWRVKARKKGYVKQKAGIDFSEGDSIRVDFALPQGE